MIIVLWIYGFLKYSKSSIQKQMTEAVMFLCYQNLKNQNKDNVIFFIQLDGIVGRKTYFL